MRISDWSSDVCSSDIAVAPPLTSSLSRGMSRPRWAIATVPKRSRDVRPFRFATKGANTQTGQDYSDPMVNRGPRHVYLSGRWGGNRIAEFAPCSGIGGSRGSDARRVGKAWVDE